MSLSADTSSRTSPPAAPIATGGATSQAGSAAARPPGRRCTSGIGSIDRIGPRQPAARRRVAYWPTIGADVDHGVDRLPLQGEDQLGVEVLELAARGQVVAEGAGEAARDHRSSLRPNTSSGSSTPRSG